MAKTNQFRYIPGIAMIAVANLDQTVWSRGSRVFQSWQTCEYQCATCSAVVEVRLWHLLRLDELNWTGAFFLVYGPGKSPRCCEVSDRVCIHMSRDDFSWNRDPLLGRLSPRPVVAVAHVGLDLTRTKRPHLHRRFWRQLDFESPFWLKRVLGSRKNTEKFKRRIFYPAIKILTRAIDHPQMRYFWTSKQMLRVVWK